VEDMFETIKNKSTEVYTIAIIGAGGSGKTTIAKAIYNELSGTFTEKSFIEDIGQVSATRWDFRLEERLLSDVLKTKVEIPSSEMGRRMIQERLSGKKVLIVFDDVTKFYELFELRACFGGGTVIIITTRLQFLAKKYQTDTVFRIKLMNPNESLELLSWHAFREAKPKEEYNDLAPRVAAYCGGLPLALEVIGSSLFERTKEEWNSALFTLAKIPPYDVDRKLKISFNGLRNEIEKDLFLDVCCFFVGKDRAYVTKILNGCGVDADSGIRVLIERNLVKVNKKNKLGMHPLLQEMGIIIIFEISEMKPGKNSRLRFRKDAEDILREIIVRTLSLCGWKLLSKVFFFFFLICSMFVFLLLFSSQGTTFIGLFPVKVPSVRRDWLDRLSVKLAVNPEYLFQKLRWIIAHRFSSQYPHNNFYVHDAIAVDLKCSTLRLFWKEPQVLLLAILH